MFCSHCLINDSPSCLHTTLYLEDMLQAFWNVAEVNYRLSHDIHILSHDGLQKVQNNNFA